MNNAVLESAWQRLRAEILEACKRAYAEGRGLPTLEFECCEVDERTGRIVANLSDGTSLHVDFDCIDAAIAGGMLERMNCFGSKERPN